MSSRSQALFRSITEVKHVLRQHYLQFNRHSRRTFTLVSGPHMVLENSARVAGRNSTVGWNDGTSASNFSNLMTGCSPTSAYRDRRLKKCEGLRCTCLRGATADDIPMSALARKAVASQANRKHLRWTVHSDLNRLTTAGRLCCAYVAPRVSVNCNRPVAAAGRRAGCAGS